MDLSLAAVIFMGGYVVAIVAAGLVMTLRPGGASVRFAPIAMPPAGENGRREEILLGGEAETLGNPRGAVQAVRLRPGTPQLQNLELASGFGFLEQHDVPAAAILAADGQLVQLDERGTEQDEGRTGEGIVLRRNMPVIGIDGKRLGRLRLICFDGETRLVTSLVVVGSRTERAPRLISIERVREVGHRGIVTEVKANELRTLPVFATDAELRQAIVQELQADQELYAFRRSLIVDVEDQQVHLRGFVPTRADAKRAVERANAVPGALAVESSMISDEELAKAVTQALSGDPTTAPASVRVSAHLGTVQLIGEAPDRVTARRIEAVAGRVPGVQAVHNIVAVRMSTAAAKG